MRMLMRSVATSRRDGRIGRREYRLVGILAPSHKQEQVSNYAVTVRSTYLQNRYVYSRRNGQSEPGNAFGGLVRNVVTLAALYMQSKLVGSEMDPVEATICLQARRFVSE